MRESKREKDSALRVLWLGDGEWMRNWEERMKNAGAILVTGAGIIANEAPDGAAIDALKAAGKEMVSV